MGHDISGFNKAGLEIAYARFSMSNHNSIILYGLLGAHQFYAGVSGCGRSSTFSFQQIENAMNNYQRIYGKEKSLLENNWDLKQILSFIQNCLVTAEKEGSVRVYFG